MKISRSDFAGDGQADHLVASGGDHRDLRPQSTPEAAHYGLSKSDHVINDKRCAGQQQGGATHQHIHPCELLRNRMVTISEHRLSGSRLRTSPDVPRHRE